MTRDERRKIKNRLRDIRQQVKHIKDFAEYVMDLVDCLSEDIIKERDKLL